MNTRILLSGVGDYIPSVTELLAVDIKKCQKLKEFILKIDIDPQRYNLNPTVELLKNIASSWVFSPSRHIQLDFTPVIPIIQTQYSVPLPLPQDARSVRSSRQKYLKYIGAHGRAVEEAFKYSTCFSMCAPLVSHEFIGQFILIRPRRISRSQCDNHKTTWSRRSLEHTQ